MLNITYKLSFAFTQHNYYTLCFLYLSKYSVSRAYLHSFIYICNVYCNIKSTKIRTVSVYRMHHNAHSQPSISIRLRRNTQFHNRNPIANCLVELRLHQPPHNNLIALIPISIDVLCGKSVFVSNKFCVVCVQLLTKLQTIMQFTALNRNLYYKSPQQYSIVALQFIR